LLQERHKQGHPSGFVKALSQWEAIGFSFVIYATKGGIMKEKCEEKVSFDGKKVKVLGGDFEKGKPQSPYEWRKKLRSRKEMLEYLESGERYWFSQEWFGSEKRKTPA
jgi:hypothetical protein